MSILDSRRDRAAALILTLGIGLFIALWPFVTGLVGALVLFVMFNDLHQRLKQYMGPGLAAGLVILLAIVLVVGPGIWFVTLLATEAQDAAGGVIRGPLLGRLSQLRIGPYQVGTQIEALGSQLVSWLGSSALGLVGTATRLGLQLTIAFFGLFYLLISPDTAWRGMRPFIPFSTANAIRLRQRFRDVTISTLIGTFATAAIQGVMVGVAFWVLGLANPVLWGAVTVVVAILPVVGSGLVWGPGVLVLVLENRYGAAIGLALWGLVVVGNVDNIVRPAVFRRYAQIHPFVTVIGAFAGIRYFGLLGLMIGPLAISYFFELLRMYKEEYGEPDDNGEVVAKPSW